MTSKRYKNPVNNYFIYNNDNRKSTCKVCYFDMAGRHSENLMRHLKRKHPTTHAKVMIEKQRRQSTTTKTNQSGLDTTDPLSTMFKFDTEPHKLFIKSEHLEFRLEEPEQRQRNKLEDDVCGEYNGDDIVNKEAEVQSAGKQHDLSKSISYDDIRDNVNHFIITSLPEQQPHEPPVSPTITSARIANPVGNAISQMANDDASLLQLLGYKFNKYNPKTKYTVQYLINRILYKADMGCYDNADANRLPDSDL